jgi:hypothetical protein
MGCSGILLHTTILLSSACRIEHLHCHGLLSTGPFRAVGQRLVMRDEAAVVKVLNASKKTRYGRSRRPGRRRRCDAGGMLFEVNFRERQPGELSPAGTLIPMVE